MGANKDIDRSSKQKAKNGENVDATKHHFE